MYLGSTVGLLSCPPLIAAYGWPSVFYFFGALGFAWWLAWQALTAPSPALSATITPAELAYISDNTEPTRARPLDSVPWRALLSNKATWAIIVAHFCCTWGYFVLNAWLPTFLNQQLGFDLASSAFLSVLPWLAMFLSANLGGRLADGLFARGVPLTRVRKLMQGVGFLGPAVFLGLAAASTAPATVIACMTAALALGSFSQSGVYSNHQDIGPRYAGLLLGMSNTAAAVPGIIGVPLTGFILDATGNWSYVFGIAIGFYLLGTAVYTAFASGEKQFD
jgi:MFS transporter, ACS family, solute carrier family 17 (sodium-dependent inorganic phosphate cotransporter), other